MKPGDNPVSELIGHIKRISETFRIQIDDCLPWNINRTLKRPEVRIYMDSPADFNEISASAGICIEVNEDFLSHEGDKAILHVLNDEHLDHLISELEKARDLARSVNKKLYSVPGISHLE